MNIKTWYTNYKTGAVESSTLLTYWLILVLIVMDGKKIYKRCIIYFALQNCNIGKFYK
jgi:hypothetical protein